MNVTVMLSTTLRNYVPGYTPSAGISLNLDGPLTVRELAEKLGLPLTEIKIVMLNGRHATLDHNISDNDRVGYFPAVGGG